MLASSFPMPLASPSPLPTLLMAKNSSSMADAKLPAAPRAFTQSGLSMPLKLPFGFAPPPGLTHPLFDVHEEEHWAMSDKSTTDPSDSTSTPDLDELGEVGYVPGRTLRSAIVGPTDGNHPSQALELSNTIPDPPTAYGSPECPSLGSIHHHLGLCVPCDFINRTDACRMGAACKFCHLCGPEANKQKKKQRARALKIAKWQEAMTQNMRHAQCV